MNATQFPTCPVCGCEADWFYRRDGEIIGCCDCTERISYTQITEERDGDREYADRKRWEEEDI